MEAQLGRSPRDPWRVLARCSFGYPTVIASPAVLHDGSRFPTWAWLTCPHLRQEVSRRESAGEIAQWASRAAAEPELAAGLRTLDAQVRSARDCESDGRDVLADVGLAGQRDPLGVKCLHAHVAYALAGLDDPIGRGVLLEIAEECEDERCALLSGVAKEDRL